MQFDQSEAVNILQQQTVPVEVKNDAGFVRSSMSPAAAVAQIQAGNFVACGNRRRIRFIRPLGSNITLADLRNGSRTVRRVTGEGHTIIAPHWIVEHRR